MTIVIVTHNVQQAARASQQCAFFLAEQCTPGTSWSRADRPDVQGADRPAHRGWREWTLRLTVTAA
jgi:hypothetical protein